VLASEAVYDEEALETLKRHLSFKEIGASDAMAFVEPTSYSSSSPLQDKKSI